MDALALRADEGRGTAPICSGEPLAGTDPEVSEWGNPLLWQHHPLWVEGTRPTETSQ
jgi:hypothetical protein